MKTTADFWLTNTSEHWTKHGKLSNQKLILWIIQKNYFEKEQAHGI